MRGGMSVALHIIAASGAGREGKGWKDGTRPVGAHSLRKVSRISYDVLASCTTDKGVPEGAARAPPGALQWLQAKHHYLATQDH